MTIKPGWTVFESPIGELAVAVGPKGVKNIYFPGRRPRLPEAARQPLPEVEGQLEAYFAGGLQAFDLELDLHGTPFQREVWQRLLEIPYGMTTTYGEVARKVEESLYDPNLEPYERPQAVGAAIGRNPVPVVVPCHRVIGADGSLTGYYGGLERKRALLDLEGGVTGTRAGKTARASGQLTF